MGLTIKPGLCLCALSRSHFLIDFYQNWHRRKNPQSLKFCVFWEIGVEEHDDYGAATTFHIYSCLLELVKFELTGGLYKNLARAKTDVLAF